MTKKPFTSDTQQISAVPVYFVDQPAALMLGATISKITFGTEESDDEMYPRPVVTIAIPTVALLQLVNDLKKQMNSSGFKRHAVTILGENAKLIADGGEVTPPGKMIEIKKEVPTKKASPSKKQSR